MEGFILCSSCLSKHCQAAIRSACQVLAWAALSSSWASLVGVLFEKFSLQFSKVTVMKQLGLQWPGGCELWHSSHPDAWNFMEDLMNLSYFSLSSEIACSPFFAWVRNPSAIFDSSFSCIPLPQFPNFTMSLTDYISDLPTFSHFTHNPD